MKKILLPLFLFSLSQTLMAESVICSRTNETVIEALKKKENRISFANEGGLVNGGVCWWHSRLERAAAYLAEYRPDLGKPSSDQLHSMLKDLTNMKPVLIPGYKNLEELTAKNQSLVQKILNGWQARDGFVNQAWVKGLSGHVHMNPEKLQAHMDDIFETFQKEKKPYFIMLQLPFVVSHAFLLLDIKQIQDGYELSVVDSNDPGKVAKQVYKAGSNALDYYGDPFVPYLGYEKDYRKMDKNLSNLCHKI